MSKARAIAQSLSEAQKAAMLVKYRAINFAVDTSEFDVHFSLQELGLMRSEGPLRGANLDLWSKTPLGREVAAVLKETE